MEITVSELRKIIREEFSKLNMLKEARFVGGLGFDAPAIYEREEKDKLDLMATHIVKIAESLGVEL